MQQFPSLIDDYSSRHQLQIINSDPQRPWGGWYLIDQGDSFKQSRYVQQKALFIKGEKFDGSFDKKILHILPDTLLSLQFHGSEKHAGHSELWMAATNLRILISLDQGVGLDSVKLKQLIDTIRIIDMEAGSSVFVPAGFLHSIANCYDTDAYLVETRLSAIRETAPDREMNITRIYDRTGRGNTPFFPRELLERIMDKDTPGHMVLQAGQFFDGTSGRVKMSGPTLMS